MTQTQRWPIKPPVEGFQLITPKTVRGGPDGSKRAADNLYQLVVTGELHVVPGKKHFEYAGGSTDGENRSVTVKSILTGEYYKGYGKTANEASRAAFALGMISEQGKVITNE